jgi:hypothetical protein
MEKSGRLGTFFAKASLAVLVLAGCASSHAGDDPRRQVGEALSGGATTFYLNTQCPSGMIETRRLQITNLDATGATYGLMDWYGPSSGSGGSGYAIAPGQTIDDDYPSPYILSSPDLAKDFVDRDMTTVDFTFPSGELIVSLVSNGCVMPATPTGPCGEAECTPITRAYISHFTDANCTGTESSYTYYSGGIGSWDGGGVAGHALRFVTNRSWKDWNGQCHDSWPDGNTLFGFATIYR